MRLLSALAACAVLGLVAASPGLAQEVPPIESLASEADPECDGMQPLPSLARARAEGGEEFWVGFRAPLPAAPVWNPPGQPRVGLQAGHWRNEEVPPELGRLQGGSFGGGKQEWQ